MSETNLIERPVIGLEQQEIEMMAVKMWRVEYDNTTHSDGDGGSYLEDWWSVTDGKRTFRAEYQDDAELLAAALNACAPPLSDNA